MYKAMHATGVKVYVVVKYNYIHCYYDELGNEYQYVNSYI